MRIDISTNAADLILELALEELKAVETGQASYGTAEDNIAAIEALTEVLDVIEASHPNTMVVKP